MTYNLADTSHHNKVEAEKMYNIKHNTIITTLGKDGNFAFKTLIAVLYWLCR